jgi:hypothetical protein
MQVSSFRGLRLQGDGGEASDARLHRCLQQTLSRSERGGCQGSGNSTDDRIRRCRMSLATDTFRSGCVWFLIMYPCAVPKPIVSPDFAVVSSVWLMGCAL